MEQFDEPSGRSCLPVRRVFIRPRASCIAQAKESVDTAAKYAYVGRKNKKREYRRLWVVRINAAARLHGLSYSVFMRGLKAAGMSSTARCWRISPSRQADAFAAVASQAKAALPAEARA